MNLSRLLLFNAVATLAASIVLFVDPGLIPNVIGIKLDRSAHVMSYLLGSSELTLAALCYYGRTLKDAKALRAIAITFIIFHASSGMAEVLALVQGVSALVWWNVGVRSVMVALFMCYGLYKT